MSKCGIYYIKNKINDMLYIGQSVDIDRRKRDHLYHLRNNCHVNTYLQNSFNFYGEASFEFGVFEYCNEDELDELEISYMDKYDVQRKGYNICDGGIHVCPDNSNENHGMWRKDIPNDELKELYLQDYNSKQLASMYGCSYRTINRRLQKIFGDKYDDLKRQKQIRGIKKQNRKNHNFRDEDIVNLANEGYNSVQIASIVGCSDSTVMDRLKKIVSDEEYVRFKKNNTAKKMERMRDKLTEESSKKIANAHKKYSLWDGSKVHYHKNCKYPKTCFYLRYNSKDLQIGGFKEFISINIIHNLIVEFVNK